ncbi:magnesium/cobalt transporter CorA [Alcaligenaceae bacterium CGII-47]|nr:magnesium/cobalt transporter CorA [Alcaligenaceae bacterium CGII-47]
MSVVAAYVYRDGCRVAGVTLEAARPQIGGSEFVWIGLHDPTPEELELLQQNFGLHPLAVEDALSADHAPKVDVYGEQIFVVARTAYLEGDHLIYGGTSAFVGKGHIITVRHGSARAHTSLRTQLEAAPSLLRQGSDYVLHAILDFIVDGYLPIMETIEDAVLNMEQTMLDSFLGRDQITRIFRLRRELILFQRVLGPMSEVCAKLVHIDVPCIDRETQPYFSDVLDHVRRVESLVSSLRDVLISVFDASQLFENERQGKITKQLAAWAAILAIPTAIAGIYGMNFEYMPELHIRYGYFIILGCMAAICAGLYVRFKKINWL